MNVGLCGRLDPTMWDVIRRNLRIEGGDRNMRKGYWRVDEANAGTDVFVGLRGGQAVSVHMKGTAPPS